MFKFFVIIVLATVVSSSAVSGQTYLNLPTPARYVRSTASDLDLTFTRATGSNTEVVVTVIFYNLPFNSNNPNVTILCSSVGPTDVRCGGLTLANLLDGPVVAIGLDGFTPPPSDPGATAAQSSILLFTVQDIRMTIGPQYINSAVAPMISVKISGILEQDIDAASVGSITVGTVSCSASLDVGTPGDGNFTLSCSIPDIGATTGLIATSFQLLGSTFSAGTVPIYKISSASILGPNLTRLLGALWAPNVTIAVDGPGVTLTRSEFANAKLGNTSLTILDFSAGVLSFAEIPLNTLGRFSVTFQVGLTPINITAANQVRVITVAVSALAPFFLPARQFITVPVSVIMTGPPGETDLSGSYAFYSATIQIGTLSCAIGPLVDNVVKCFAGQVVPTGGVRNISITLFGSTLFAGTIEFIDLGTTTYINPGVALINNPLLANISFTGSRGDATGSDLSIQLRDRSNSNSFFSCLSTPIVGVSWIACNITVTVESVYNVHTVIGGYISDFIPGTSQTVTRAVVASPVYTVLTNTSFPFSVFFSGTSGVLTASHTPSSIRIGSQTVCAGSNITFNPGTATVTCATNITLSTDNIGSLPVFLFVGATNFSTSSNRVTALTVSPVLVTPSLTPIAITGNLSRTFTVNLNIQGVSAPNTIAPSRVRIRYGNDSCQPASMPSDSSTASCVITTDGNPGFRIASVDILGSNFFLGTQRVLGTPSVLRGSASFAAGGVTIFFGTDNVGSENNITSIVVGSGSTSYPDEACTLISFVNDVVTCRVASQLPEAGVNINVKMSAYNTTTLSTKVGSTVDRPNIVAPSSRELAVGLVNLFLVVSAADSTSKLEFSNDGANFTVANFTTSEYDLVVSPGDISSLWTVGSVISARLTNLITGQTSFVRTIGTIVENPTAVSTGLVYVSETDIYPITGSNLGTRPSASDVIIVKFNGVECRTVTWITSSRLDCVGTFPSAAVTLEVTLLGGYTFTVPNYLTIADPKNVDLGSDTVSYIRGVAATIDLVSDVRPFPIGDIAVTFSVNNNSVSCSAPSIDQNGKLSCSVGAALFNALAQGDLVAEVNTGSTQFSRKVTIGYLHGGNPVVAALSPVPTLSLRTSLFALSSTNLYNGIATGRNVLIIRFANNETANCTVSFDLNSCSIATSPQDLPSGDVIVETIYSNSLTVPSNVRIATIYTPNITFYVYYTSNSDLAQESLLAIATRLETSLNVSSGSIRVEPTASPDPNSPASSRFLRIFPIDPSAGDAILKDSNFLSVPSGTLLNAVIAAAPGASNPTIFQAPSQPTPSQPPTQPPIRPPTEPPVLPPVVPPAADGVVSAAPLSTGAFIGIAIACVIAGAALALVGALIYSSLKKKNASGANSSVVGKAAADAAVPQVKSTPPTTQKQPNLESGTSLDEQSNSEDQDESSIDTDDESAQDQSIQEESDEEDDDDASDDDQSS